MGHGQPSGGGQQAAWRARFRQKYLSRLVAMLRRRKIERTTSLSTRSRTVKFAADLSLATTSGGRTAWSRAILGKYLCRLKKSRCQLRLVKSRENLHGLRRSASAKSGPCITTPVCKKFDKRLLGTGSRMGHNSEEAGGTVASRMQILRLLVPGSRGLETPVFLKEAADYIVALKMQVQAMQILADCCSNSSIQAVPQV